MKTYIITDPIDGIKIRCKTLGMRGIMSLAKIVSMGANKHLNKQKLFMMYAAGKPVND